jgi:hypothetical protein
LLNEHTPLKGIEGSNPSVSASYFYQSIEIKQFVRLR